MKVMEMRDGWGLEHIKPGTRPERDPGPGEVLVRMAAASVNYRDFVMTRRGYGSHSGELPLIPLSDGAGTVAKAGAGVTRVAVGDLVCPAFAQRWISGPMKEEHRAGMLGGRLDGVMQEYMLLPQQGVVKAPREWSAIEAATLPCAALTAWSAVIGGGVKAGDVVVTQGTGGVSLFAAMFAKMQGALAIVTSSSDEKLERARSFGAGLGINYKTHPEWSREVRKALGGRGADLILELGGAQTLDQSLRAIRTSGTLAMIGVLSGATAELNLGRVVTQNVRLQGVTVGNRDAFEEMVRAIDLLGGKPPIDEKRYAFDAVADAIGAIATGRHFGKICIAF
ncbi:MAG: zinc-dependent alcohol dehydrogenase family protein [Stellaceae bacterium]